MKEKSKMSGLELHKRLEASVEERINSENFDELLRLHLDAKEMISSHRLWVKSMGDACEMLGAKLAAYAQRAFAQTFDAEPLHDTANGRQGLHTMPDGTLARLTATNDKFRRVNDGDEMTQSFLKDLPPMWTKERVMLDTKALGEETDKTLLEHGIVRQDKYTWTIQKGGSGYEGIAV